MSSGGAFHHVLARHYRKMSPSAPEHIRARLTGLALAHDAAVRLPMRSADVLLMLARQHAPSEKFHLVCSHLA